ncbi:hypothetical protein BCR36DRAFT_253230, partial [Piromyces finnis]
MGEPIKKLGQIVNDIQDTLGQFNDISSKSSDINISVERKNNIINNNIINDENSLCYKNEGLNKKNNNINEIVERNYNAIMFSSKAAGKIFEKNDHDMSLMLMKENDNLNNIQLHIDKNSNDISIQSYSILNDENNDTHQSKNTNIGNDEKSIDINNKEYYLDISNNNLIDNNISEKRQTKELLHNMKINIPDENTYLLMKDLIEKSKQKSENISYLNNIINEYNNENKAMKEENKNLRKINEVMKYKLDEINANLLNISCYDSISSLKEKDIAYISSFSSSKQENLITFINEVLEVISTQLNLKFINKNSVLIKITNFYKCLNSMKTSIKEFSEEKPYSLSRSLIIDVCNCFKNCQDNINNLYNENENENLNNVSDDDDVNVLKERYKKSLNTISQLELENKEHLMIINELNSKINKTEKISNIDPINSNYIIKTKYNDITQRYNKLLVENENMKKNQIYLENLIEKWKLENDKLQKAIISFKNEFPIDKDLLQKNRILKNKLDDERLNIKKYTELIKALKIEIDQLRTDSIQDNEKLTKQMSSELSNIKDIQSLYLESINQITNKYNENESDNINNNNKIINKQIDKLFDVVQESDKIKNQLTKLEQIIEEQIKEKERVIVENKKIRKEFNELQNKLNNQENSLLKKCRDLNTDLNNTKDLLAKTHNDYLKKEQEVFECQAIIDDYLLQYSKACDTCIAISSIHSKPTQFLDNLHLKPGLSKHPFPFDEEIRNLCSWIKENENDIKAFDFKIKELNKLLDSKNQEIVSLKNKSEELKTNISNLQLSYDEARKKEKDYEEKLEHSLQKQN